MQAGKVEVRLAEVVPIRDHALDRILRRAAVDAKRAGRGEQQLAHRPRQPERILRHVRVPEAGEEGAPGGGGGVGWWVG